MQWVPKNGIYRGFLDDSARIHDPNSIGNLCEYTHVVCDYDESVLLQLLNILKKLQHASLHDHIQRSHRFVRAARPHPAQSQVRPR